VNPPLAILGGTFDPVHNAHLAIARHALGRLGCARVLWIPTGAPGYRSPPVASGADRLAMLRLATQGEKRWQIDERELAPGHSGYTVDTLIALRAESDAKTPLLLLLGGDQYARIETWHRWRDLVQLCRIAVFERPGSEAAAAPGKVDVIRAQAPAQDVSSTEVRRRVAAGENVATLVPAPVLAYIRSHHLYR
jgi:nicotinate-nucleotide adenylyltransferase